MVNDAMTQCRYCAVPLDEGVAKLLAERQTKTNAAYSDASFLRTAAVSLFVFLGISMFFGLAYWGFVSNFIVAIFLLIRWQMRYQELLTDDPDYQQARRSKNVAIILLIVAAPFLPIFNPFLDLIVREFGL
jgi:hypothetical protein